MPLMNRRELHHRIPVFLITLILALLVAEGLVRWLAPADIRHGTAWYEGHPVYHFRHRPNLDRDFWWAGTYRVRTNSRGLREDMDVPYDGGPARTVLFFGDSFTFGNGVENRDCFVRRVERSFQAAFPGSGARFINMGVSGYGPGLEYLYFQEEGRKYRPDVVVIQVYTGNDVQDDLRVHAFEIASSGLTRVPYRIPWLKRLTRLPAYLWLVDNSHLLLKLKVAHDRLRDRKDPALAAPFDSSGASTYESAWLLSEAIWTAFIGDIRKAGARPILLLIPPPAEVDLAAQRTPRLFNPFFSERTRRSLTRLAERENVPVVDMLPVFTGALLEGTDAYLDADFHLNGTGHEKVAEAILPLIEAAAREDRPPRPDTSSSPAYVGPLPAPRRLKG